MGTNINYEKLRHLTRDLDTNGLPIASDVEINSIYEGITTMLSGKKMKPIMKAFLSEIGVLEVPVAKTGSKQK